MRKIRLWRGKVRIKIKGKKPIYINFPPLDEEKRKSIKFLSKICEKLFDGVETLDLTLAHYKSFVKEHPSFVLKTNPFLFYSLKLLEKWKVDNFKIEKSGLLVGLPKFEIKRRYGVKDDFALLFLYGGKTLFHTTILTEKKKEADELEKIRRLTRDILGIYGNFYEKEEEMEKYIHQKFFPQSSKPIKDFIELKPFFEKIEISQKVSLTKKVEEKISSKSQAPPEKPLEVIEKEVYRFLSHDFRKLESFADKALYMRLKEVDLKKLDEEQKRKVYKVLDKYFSSQRSLKDLEEVMETLASIFSKSVKLY